MERGSVNPVVVYRIWDRERSCYIGCYSNGRDVFDFHSVESARRSNCHDIFADKSKYRIDAMLVRYTPAFLGVDDAN